MLVALAVIAGAVVATRDDRAPDASTAPSVAGPSSTGPATTAAPLPASPRSPGKVTVRMVDPRRAVVTWSTPTERSGLTGYVVTHRPRFAGTGLTSQDVPGRDAAEATVPLPSSGSRCFVVQPVYSTGQGTPSEPACT